MSKFETKYGYFTDDGNEYVITNHKTPKPWINVISNGEYGLVISQIGSGFSWNEHSEFNRLNRWHQDLIQDNWGKYFYFKNNETGEVWSPFWMPVKNEIENYECRVGFGYSKFSSVYKDIKVNARVFVPLDENLEIWDFEIVNNSKIDLDLSIYTYFEWCLGSSADHHREFHKTFLETTFLEELNALTGTKRLWEIPLGDRGHWNIEYPYQGFISSNIKISDYTGDKEDFIGQYGSVAEPVGIKKNVLGKKTSKWNDSVAVIKIDLKIKSGESKNGVFYLGIKKDFKEIENSLKKFQTKDQIETAFQEVAKKWASLFGTLEIQTPDESMNLLVNKWLRYQTIAGRIWGRTAYYQQSGAYGFRDQLQDSLVFLPIDPTLTKNQIKLHARHQFENGAVLHWWHPISETGLLNNMSDNLLWLPFLIINYIDETGDYSLLNENEPFYDNKNLQASLFEHSDLAIKRVLSRLSPRGLTLIGAGDWNDGLSAVGLDMKGESIWLSQFFYFILVRFAAIAKKFNQTEKGLFYESEAEKIKNAFNEHAWDGEWFYAATKDNGQKIGSKESPEGKVFLNTQTWSVISEITSEEKQKEVMNVVKEKLLKEFGALLLAPAYSIPDKYVGYLSRYAPGRRENGGTYTHAATWAVWAFSKIKDSKNTFEAYKRINPILNGLQPDKYVAEPYVTPGNIDGPDSPDYGMGGWTWYTGSASWLQKVIVDWILGVRASEKGLIIDPCIPNDWKSFKVKRNFRNKTFMIEVLNESASNFGVKKIFVDGVVQNENIIIPENYKQQEIFIKIII